MVITRQSMSSTRIYPLYQLGSHLLRTRAHLIPRTVLPESLEGILDVFDIRKTLPPRLFPPFTPLLCPNPVRHPHMMITPPSAIRKRRVVSLSGGTWSGE